MFGKLGIILPRVARSQAKVGAYVSKEDLAYGDLVFFPRMGSGLNN
ncbi:C40 family peptidase [Lutispora thermophila]|uniref:C40 family peptidase n=1 Tax=Lutispora saccharofermentans TaxID=3024236 RepID=A0ABT1NH67_9FIRM|nr:C40 family peptidase [Lutispora saccharofermentans]